MGYRLEITKGKNKGEKISKEQIELILETTKTLVEQVTQLLDDVNAMEELENTVKEQAMIIESLTNDIEKYNNEIKQKNNKIDELKMSIDGYKIEVNRQNNKIERIENEAQERYDDNCKLKDKIIDLVNEKNALEKKLAKINEVFKNIGDDI